MALDAIMALPVGDLAAPDSALLLWAALFEEGFEVLKAWGFGFRSHAVWVKPSVGMGQWFRQQHEMLLLGVRGNMPVPLAANRRGLKLIGRVDRCGPCPVCNGIDRFSISVKKQLWNCRGCQRGGDVIALMQHLDGSTFRETVLLLTGEPAPERQAPNVPTPVGSNANEDGQRAALRLWSESVDPRGTLAERYLTSRPEKLALPDDLAGSVIRFNGATPWHDDDSGELMRVPCVIALMRNVLTGKPCAIQKTRLTPDGAKIARRMRGPAKGAAIMLDGLEGRDNRLAHRRGPRVCHGGAGARLCPGLGARLSWRNRRFPRSRRNRDADDSLRK
jgi:hypothetical protein